MTNKSDTPLTDLEEDYASNWAIEYGSRQFVPAGFARDLEHKLANVTEQRDGLMAAAKRTIEENGHLAYGEVCTLIMLKKAVRSIKQEIEPCNAPHEGRTAALSPGVPLDAVVGRQNGDTE